MGSWFLIICTILILAITSCGTHTKGHAGQNGEDAEIHLINVGDTLKFELGFFGDEDRARIDKPPLYNTFDNFCSNNREPLIYCYTPVSEFDGRDTVILKFTFGSDGSSEGTDHKFQELIFEFDKN